MTIIPFKSKRVLIGSNLFYTCEATRGNIEWFKDVGPVSVLLPSVNLSGVSVKSSYDGKIIRKDLVFKKVNYMHSGRYRCKQTFGDKTFGKIVQLSVFGEYKYFTLTIVYIVLYRRLTHLHNHNHTNFLDNSVQGGKAQ